METTFTFTKHAFEPEKGLATFSYQLQTPEKTYDFVEKLHFQPISTQTTNYQLLTTILDNLLLILGISYYKTYCPKKIELNTINLTKEQATFWNTVYTKGLGEFFYKNKLDYHDLINFPYVDVKKDLTPRLPKPGTGGQVTLSYKEREKLFPLPMGEDQGEGNNGTIEQFNNTRSLVFFGGGKDSIVTAELLKKQNMPFDLFLVDPVNLQKNGAEIAGAKTIEFKREIDPQLLELNKQEGVYNGHIPISAVWAFISLLASALYGYKYLITSNEHSANYGNVEYLGEEINHQWSKSLEFETMFREYVKTNISNEIEYFSLLRPLYEIKIAELFSKHTEYFHAFSSCNRNFKIHESRIMNHESSLWCGECPKCLFVFILLNAFLDKKPAIEIFGKNLFDDYSLLPLLRELLNLENFKPFECVGTPDETQLALCIISQKKEYQNMVLISLFLQSFPLNEQSINILQEKLLQAKLPACVPHEFSPIIETI